MNRFFPASEEEVALSVTSQLLGRGLSGRSQVGGRTGSVFALRPLERLARSERHPRDHGNLPRHGKWMTVFRQTGEGVSLVVDACGRQVNRVDMFEENIMASLAFKWCPHRLVL